MSEGKDTSHLGQVGQSPTAPSNIENDVKTFEFKPLNESPVRISTESLTEEEQPEVFIYVMKTAKGSRYIATLTLSTIAGMIEQKAYGDTPEKAAAGVLLKINLLVTDVRIAFIR